MQNPALQRVSPARHRPRAPRRILVAAGAVLALSAAFAAGGRSSGSAPAQDGFPDLIAGLKEVEGCLGVESARTAGGKNVIFAWFEDKKACKRWYYSDTHQSAMDFFFPDREVKQPMEDVPEEVGPILAIASLTPDPAPDADSPFSQIAIELYTPITPGIKIGGSFAPESLVVPKRKVIVDRD